MAIQLNSEGWAALFEQSRSPTMFLSNFFTLKQGGIFDGDKVALDVQRFGESIAVPVRRATGPNLNRYQDFTNVEFTPPVYMEEAQLNIYDQIARMIGVDPHSSAYAGYAGRVVMSMATAFVQMEAKLMRGVELQASQVLQTGKLSLTNKEGTEVYEIDFKPKATHFPTVSVSWGTEGADPLNDIESLSKVIRSDGMISPNTLVMGDKAFKDFKRDDQVMKELDNRRMTVGELAPMQADTSGATYYGYIFVGSYRYNIWVYPATYKNPADDTVTDYIDANKVIVMSDMTRLDKLCARVPPPLQVDSRVAHLLPGRMSSMQSGFDITPNVYVSPDGRHIFGQVETSMLCAPVQIDGFGCLTTEA